MGMEAIPDEGSGRWAGPGLLGVRAAGPPVELKGVKDPDLVRLSTSRSVLQNLDEVSKEVTYCRFPEAASELLSLPPCESFTGALTINSLLINPPRWEWKGT